MPLENPVEAVFVDHFKMLTLGRDDTFRNLVYYNLSKSFFKL